MICPTCSRDASVLVTNIKDGTQFCHACAPPSFLPHFVLTVEDVQFLRDCGIDAEVSRLEQVLLRHLLRANNLPARGGLKA